MKFKDLLVESVLATHEYNQHLQALRHSNGDSDQFRYQGAAYNTTSFGSNYQRINRTGITNDHMHKIVLSATGNRLSNQQKQHLHQNIIFHPNVTAEHLHQLATKGNLSDNHLMDIATHRLTSKKTLDALMARSSNNPLLKQSIMSHPNYQS